MKKRYIIITVALLLVCAFFAGVLLSSDKENDTGYKSNIPRIGQYLWTYNMNKHEWHVYSKNDDLESKEEVILQVGYNEGNGGYTVYHTVSGNVQLKKEELWFGEGSQEFIKNKVLYSYYPKVFEFYKIIFNGVTFIPDKLSVDAISEIYKDYNLVKVSDLKKGNNSFKYSKFNNKYIIINDIGDAFYKYYIVPNDSKKMQIEELSNQFKVSAPVEIKLQRIEGCSKSYPCYDIHIE